MTDKERLIDLMIDAKRTEPETGSFTEYLADYLLEHGVIVPPYLQVEVSEKLERKIKAEAVKEFAEKFEMAFFIKQDEQREQMLDILKSHRATLSYSDVEQATDNWLRGYGESVQDVIGILDNLLKETAGDTE